MIVKYLELQNYRRFKHVQLELPEGIIGIVGLNGVGKSTLLEAIAWALYGNQLEITRTKKGEVKSSTALPTEPCKVILEFTLNGNNYRLVRELRGKNQTMHVEIILNNQTAATNAKPVSDFLLRNLGMDYKSFFASVFARQNELNALSSEKPHERRKLVLRMLNIELVENILIKIRSNRKDLKKELEGMRFMLVDENGNDIEKKWRGEREALKDSQMELKKKLKLLEREKKRKEKELKKVAKEFDAYEKKYTKYKVNKNELETLERSLTKLNADKKGYERQLEKLRKEEKELTKLETDEKKYRELESEENELEAAAELHNQHNTLKKQISTNEEKMAKLKEQQKNFGKQFEFFSGLETELHEIGEAKSELEAAMTALNDNISRQNQNAASLSKIIEERESHLKDIKNLGPDSTCPTCERPLNEHFDFLLGKLDGQLSDKREELRAVKEILKELDVKRKELDKKKEKIEKKDNQLQDSKLRREELRTKLKGFSDDINEIEAALKDDKSELSGLPRDIFDPKRLTAVKGQIGKLKRIHERYVSLKESITEIPQMEMKINELNSELQTAEKTKKNVEDKNSRLGFDEHEYQRLSNERLSVNTAFQEAVRELSVKSQELEHSIEKTENLDKQILDIQQKKDKIKVKEEQMNYLSTLAEIMDKFKTNLISRIRPLLSRYGSEFLIKLTDGRYSELELDENYDIFIYDEGEKYELKRFSGGEEDIANLSIRLAISRIIAESAGTTGINMIILDEIFGSQDIYRKRNIVSLLNELTNQYQQIFLITHVDEMKDRMGYVIEVNEDSEGECSIVKILD